MPFKMNAKPQNNSKIKVAVTLYAEEHMERLHQKLHHFEMFPGSGEFSFGNSRNE